MDIATIFTRGFFVVLAAAVAITVTIVLVGHFREQLPPEAVCPAQWKCVGPPDTRDPDCKCWDKY